MQNIIKIGVTYTGTDEKHNNYVNWLKEQDRVEVITLNPAYIDPDTVSRFDGIVLSGGIDMHPKYYNSDVTVYPNSPDHFNEARDAFEVTIFEITRQHQIPLLGVCRGMQLVNCALGGTLTQDIGPVGNAIHKYEHNDKVHGINILQGSLLHVITGIERTVTNSAHHQSIKVLGRGLEINCRSDDGLIEGVEWSEKAGKQFFLGVQWHPERMFKLHLEDSPVTKSIRDRFINEIKQSIESKS